MVTAEQWAFMYQQAQKFRETKPIFTEDYWNDGEFVDGCIAGGRRSLHINAAREMEPCVFIHYSDSNIHEKPLAKALQSSLFLAYKDGQPFNDNHLRPCPLMNNLDALCHIVDTLGAVSTDMQNPEDVHELTDKRRSAAKNWAPVADEIWACSSRCHSCESLEEDNEQEAVFVPMNKGLHIICLAIIVIG